MADLLVFWLRHQNQVRAFRKRIRRSPPPSAHKSSQHCCRIVSHIVRPLSRIPYNNWIPRRYTRQTMSSQSGKTSEGDVVHTMVRGVISETPVGTER